MKRNGRDYLGLSLFLTAITLTVAFIVMCIKKRNLPAALAGLATLYATGGLWLVSERRYQKCEVCDCFEGGLKEKKGKKNKEADHKLTHRKDSLPIFDIPVDVETTEEDFAR